MSVYLPKGACKMASIDSDGERRKFSEDEIKYNYYYDLQCLISGHVGMVDIIYPEIYKSSDDKGYLERLVEIGRVAQEKNVKLLPIVYDGGPGNNYLAFLEDKERIKALTYKYFIEIERIPGEDEGGNITVMPFISGVLFNYDLRNIRGYYLRYYLLKGKEIPGENSDDEFIDPKVFYEKRYEYIKKRDNFSDFDSQFNKIKKDATDLMKKVTASKKFRAFAKLHAKDIKDYKFQPKYFS